MDDHCIYVRNIEPCLNNSRRDQHINLPVNKIAHDAFQLLFPHLTVGKCHIDIRHQFLDMRSSLCNIFHTVIYIIDLSGSCAFSLNRFPHHLIIVLHDIRLNRHTILGSFLKHTHITNPDQAHVQRSWNRRCSQRKHIYIFF